MTEKHRQVCGGCFEESTECTCCPKCLAPKSDNPDCTDCRDFQDDKNGDTKLDREWEKDSFYEE